MTKNKKIIGILGGMGPEAGCILNRYINLAAKEILGTSGDEDYPDIIHFSIPRIIPDRSDYLLGLTEENPAEPVAHLASLMADTSEKLEKPMVACVACDTFHANPIWRPFCKKIEGLQNLQMINMIDETVLHLKTIAPPPAKIAIFGTLGTYKEKIYESRLLPLGYEVLGLTHQQQHDIHQAIYNPTFGIKANSQKTETACNLVLGVVKLLKEQKVQKIILGCTELSIVISHESDDIFIDPMSIAAKKLVLLSRE